MNMIKIRQHIARLLVMTIFVNLAFPINIFAAENDFKWVAENGYEFTDKDIKSIIPVLEVINKIPDELLKTGSQEEIVAFCTQQGRSLNVYNDNIGEVSYEMPQYVLNGSIGKCALSIGQLIVTVGIPASKLLKIKKYIAALGGVKEAAALLVGATTASEKAQGILTALGGVLATITGIDGIKEHCLS